MEIKDEKIALNKEEISLVFKRAIEIETIGIILK